MAIVDIVNLLATQRHIRQVPQGVVGIATAPGRRGYAGHFAVRIVGIAVISIGQEPVLIIVAGDGLAVDADAIAVRIIAVIVIQSA